MKTWKKIAAFVGFVGLLASTCAVIWWWVALRPLPDTGRRVLVFSETGGYRHESIPAAVTAIEKLGRQERFNVVVASGSEVFTEQSLAPFAAVVFLNTTGDVLDSAQQESFERYIQGGGGFVGVHAAADTEWQDNRWPWYTRLVGAAFKSHPEQPSNVQEATVRLVTSEHPSTAGLPQEWRHSDEWYDYQRFDPRVRVLLTVDESSYQGGITGSDHPIAWYRDFDGGHSFYTGLGHTAAAFSDPRFMQHLAGGLAYAIGDATPVDYARSRPESWRLRREVVAGGLGEPMGLAFRPDGVAFVAERGGTIRRLDQGAWSTVAELGVSTEGEKGLQSLVFDPGYPDRPWLYVFRTIPSGTAHRVSRFTLDGETLLPDSEQILLEIPTEPGEGLHIGGDLVFGEQGRLWISVGDNTSPRASGGYSPLDDRPGSAIFDAARSAGNTMDLRGKILRIQPTADGYTVPEGNLFPDAEQGRSEIYVMGVRNPFRIAVDDGVLYWGDIGPDAQEDDPRGPRGYDEFNRTDAPGNFGWPFFIADNQPYASARASGQLPDPDAPINSSANNTGAARLPPAQPAWIAYPYALSEDHYELGDGGRAGMAGAVFRREAYRDDPCRLPEWYDGRLFLFDWMRRWILSAPIGTDGAPLTLDPVGAPGSYIAPIDLSFGPDGALYVLEYGSAWFTDNPDARLVRLCYDSGDNPPPVAAVYAEPAAGVAPLAVRLDASETHDPNHAPAQLTYRWFQQTPTGRRLVGEGPTIDHTIVEPGRAELVVEVTDSDGGTGSAVAVVRVGNAPPQIKLALDGAAVGFFTDDGHLDYSAAIQDLEDGSLLDGIAPDEVQVSFAYFPRGIPSQDLGHQPGPSPGAMLVRGSDCSACHQAESQSVGPSFRAIAERYAGDSQAPGRLARKIIEGGAGSWGDVPMAAHPSLSLEDAERMVAHVLGRERVGGGLPPRGTIHFQEHAGDHREIPYLGSVHDGQYLLRVSYLDRGAPGAEALSVTAQAIFRSRVVSAAGFSAMENIQLFAPPQLDGAEILVFLARHEERSWAALSQVDLTGVGGVQLQALAMQPFFRGGSVSLRLDSPDGIEIARAEVAQIGIGIPTEVQRIDLPFPPVTGVHDLYLVGERRAEDPADRDLFAVLLAEFLPAAP